MLQLGNSRYIKDNRKPRTRGVLPSLTQRQLHAHVMAKQQPLLQHPPHSCSGDWGLSQCCSHTARKRGTHPALGQDGQQEQPALPQVHCYPSCFF